MTYLYLNLSFVVTTRMQKSNMILMVMVMTAGTQPVVVRESVLVTREVTLVMHQSGDRLLEMK